jgi:DNA-binding LacI/PurR family transcriptional regulator
MSRVSLQDIADRLGVSVKTVSGALHDDSIRMSASTRARIRALAEKLGYQPNIVARGMRKGVMPIIGLVAEGLITQPFATEIVRSLDNAARGYGLSIFATSVGASRSAEDGVNEARRLMPTSIAFATMYHRVVELPAPTRRMIALTINCRDCSGAIPAIVPDERRAAQTIVEHCFARGRRRIAFLNLPGLLAGSLREEGFRAAHAALEGEVRDDWIRPATRGTQYTDFAHSLVLRQVEDLLKGSPRPDAILCGNDRVAMEVYGALRRFGIAIPDDVAVVSFDNQIEIARRLDPPLTTMALPHRAIGRRSAEILAGVRPATSQVEEIPFRLVERASV